MADSINLRASSHLCHPRFCSKLHPYWRCPHLDLRFQHSRDALTTRGSCQLQRTLANSVLGTIAQKIDAIDPVEAWGQSEVVVVG
jgi:hypothetical protein